MPKGHSVGLAS